ncbi:hypothetical protein C4K30_2106 [Pseudomonas chlororaphis subsp. piscium]|nr:hypothetical protein C4K30_2106 [Pseudomonas chlororaphis subsp. piscium]
MGTPGKMLLPGLQRPLTHRERSAGPNIKPPWLFGAVSASKKLAPTGFVSSPAGASLLTINASL